MTDSEPHTTLPIERRHRTKDMSSSGRVSNEKLSELGVIYSAMEDSKLLNAYRDLRGKLLRLSNGQNFVCLVCAIAPDDESSLLAANLGSVIAFDASRSSMVVDCDTQANVLDGLVSKLNPVGLTEFIEQDMDDVASLINDSGIDRMRIIACGEAAHTRTESLESSKMREIILELKERYNDRFLFINAPSMRLSGEVQILANVCDMVLFQITSGLVTEQQVKDAVDLIGPDKVAGIVLKET